MRQHIKYLDALRITAMLGVMFLHIAGVLISGDRVAFGTADWELLNAGDSLACSSVALFFMISGFLLLSSPKTGDVSILLKKRLPRLVVPLLAWTFVAAVWVGHLADDYSLGGLLRRMTNGIYGPILIHFWFMFTLIALYVISPILCAGLNNLDRKGRLFVLALILCVHLQYMLRCILPESLARYIQFDLIGKLTLFDGALSVFVLGWYLGTLKKRIPNWILILAALALFVSVTLGSRSFYLQNGDYDASFHKQTMGYEVCLAACVFLLFKQNIGQSERALPLAAMAPLSYPIYFLHVITMELFFGLGWTPSGFLGAIGFVLLNTLLCFLLTKTAASVPLLCYLSTGLRFPEACESCNWQYSLRLRKETRG